ncbi:heme exporter protein CcmD [Sansalvadorimonas sp. 2012CJ34-2]|uniref:Heme exporter protein D n=1 Tax=Parendozoicomonas callyspongiae TaxID=2942213 RepID=A0ABT0PK55_9GAMM|nr:heme exporter protein CcmD [Sansalvadorimonas sp. 2012CJ34-2]MCL6271656.1 heme exporter protein CcmD [Sansalvadorimonas sp. 2012CJ34-2]
MYFEDLNSLISMGGHGPYVWGAYLLGFIVLGWNLVSPILHRKKTIAELRRQLRREGRL